MPKQAITSLIDENLKHNGFEFSDSRDNGRHAHYANHKARLFAVLHWKEDFTEATIEITHYPHDNIPVDGYRVAFEYIRALPDLAGALGKAMRNCESKPLVDTEETPAGAFKSEFLVFSLTNAGNAMALFRTPTKNQCISLSEFCSTFCGVPLSIIPKDDILKLSHISLEGTGVEYGWYNHNTRFLDANCLFPMTDVLEVALEQKVGAEAVLKEARLIITEAAKRAGATSKTAITRDSLKALLNCDTAESNITPGPKNLSYARIHSADPLGGVD